MKRFKQWLCRIFGHKFTLADAVVCLFNTDKMNGVDGKLTCRRCGEVF